MIEDISHLFPALNIETNYRVVYRGRLLEGQSEQRVKARLKADLGMDENQVSAFLSKKKFIVRQDLPRRQAAKLRARLRNAGLDVVANSSKGSAEVSPQISKPRAPLKRSEPESSSTSDSASRPVVKAVPASTQHEAVRREPAKNLTETPTFVTQRENRSRWIVIGLCSVFALAVVWLFFSI